MEERSSGSAGLECQGTERWWQRDAVYLLALLLLAGGLRAWGVTHTAVVARDSIGFIRYAWRLEHEPWNAVLRESLHPPLYPATVLAVSVPLRHVLPAADCLVMQYSAQIATALCGVLLVIPMFYLGRDLFDRQVGFWSAALFQCLPVGARALSDGLTEGIFLLLTATFIVLAGRALRRGWEGGFALCGLCSGLAYLARPEGAALAVLLGSVLIAAQWKLRWPIGRVFACGICLAFFAFAVASPYMVTIGGITNKTSSRRLGGLENDGQPRTQRVPQERDEEVQLADASGHLPLAVLPTCRPILAKWWFGWTQDGAHQRSSLQWALKAFAQEVSKGFHYFAWFPALLGVFFFRDRFRGNPTAWMMATLCTFHALALLRLAVTMGYLSERHSLTFVLCGAPWAVAGMRELPWRLTQWGRAWSVPPLIAEWAGHRRAVTALFVVALTFYGVPSMLRPLHPTRAGFKEAGFWIAAHAEPLDTIVDPFCWSKYYAGREFSEKDAAPPPDLEATQYVVLDRNSFDDIDNHHSHLPLLDKAKALAAHQPAVYHWPTSCDEAAALVFVYAVQGRR